MKILLFLNFIFVVQMQENIIDYEDVVTNEIQNIIPGQPSQDYPTYHRIPKTSFTCEGKVESGYYADIETNCQVFHICQNGGHKDSFLCPNGSIFNQKYSVCDWWYSFDCDQTNSLNPLEIQRINDFYPAPTPHYEGSVFYNPQEDLNIASSGGNNPESDTEKTSVRDSAINRNGYNQPQQTGRVVRNKQVVNVTNAEKNDFYPNGLNGYSNGRVSSVAALIIPSLKQS